MGYEIVNEKPQDCLISVTWGTGIEVSNYGQDRAMKTS
jgi:hypothetical protein